MDKKYLLLMVTILVILTFFIPEMGLLTYALFLFFPGYLIIKRFYKKLNYLDKITLSFAISAGILILVALLLDLLSALYSQVLLILLWLIAIISIYITKKSNKINIEKGEYLVILFTLLVPIIIYSFKHFPSTDFWFTYHHINLYVQNWLLPLGNILGWSPFWYLGSPIFYSPASLALIHTLPLLSNTNIVLSELFINALSYIFVIFSVTIFIKKYFNKTFAYLTGVLLVFSARLINEIFAQGHYASFLAIGYGTLALYFLFQKNKKKPDTIFFITFMTLSLLSHHTIFIIMNIPIFFYFLFTNLKEWKYYSLSILTTILISSFWLIPNIYESILWLASNTARDFPNPIFMYVSSYFIFLPLAFFGAYYIKRKKGWFFPIFVGVFFLLSIISAYIFPLLPNIVEDQLRKSLFLGFKSVLLTNIFLVVLIAFFFWRLSSKRKYKNLGYLLIGGYIIYGLLLSNVFVQQDTVPIIFKNNLAYRDSVTENLFLNNQELIEEFIIKNDLTKRNSINLLVSTSINSPTIGGFPGPLPLRSNYLSNEDKSKFDRFSGAKIFITKEKLESNFREKYSFNPITLKDYSINKEYLMSILKTPMKYILDPAEFPSKASQKIYRIYQVDKEEPIIEVPKYRPLTYSGKLGNEEVKREFYRIPIILSKKSIDGIKHIDKKEEISFIKTNDIRKANLVDVTPKQIVIETKNEAILPLYIKFNYSPHWKAYADNKKLPLFRTFADLMFTQVPENTNQLVLRWEKTNIDYLSYFLTLIGIYFVILIARRKDTNV